MRIDTGMGSADKAFVSSTFEDLKTHRAFVIDAIGGAGIFIDPMEDWTAEPDEPKRFSVERLGGCAPTRIRPAADETHSITQLEYQARSIAASTSWCSCSTKTHRGHVDSTISMTA